jgi:hypothetical protein
MKKQVLQIALPLLFVLLVIAYLTNPTPQDVKKEIKGRVYQELGIDTVAQNSPASIFDFFKGITNNVGKDLVDKTVDELVQINNYHVFSGIEVQYKGQTKMVGMAVFKQVYLWVNLKEAIEKYKP